MICYKRFYNFLRVLSLFLKVAQYLIRCNSRIKVIFFSYIIYRLQFTFLEKKGKGNLPDILVYNKRCLTLLFMLFYC